MFFLVCFVSFCIIIVHVWYNKSSWSLIKFEKSSLSLLKFETFTLDVINHAIIRLIPKVKDLSNASYYRRISLCNVIYIDYCKGFGKCLKSVLLNIISEEQNVFVPNIHITDNAIVASKFFTSCIKGIKFLLPAIWPWSLTWLKLMIRLNGASYRHWWFN